MAKRYGEPIRQGGFIAEVYHPPGRAFPQGQRRRAVSPAPEVQWRSVAGPEHRRLAALLAVRSGTTGVDTLARHADLAPNRVRALLEEMLGLGLVVVEEKNIRPKLGIAYQIDRAALDERSRGAINQWLGRKDADQVRQEALNSLGSLVGQLAAHGADPQAQIWLSMLQAHLADIEAGRRPRLADGAGKTIAQYPGQKYLTVWHGVAGCVSVAAGEDGATLREISDRFLGSSKVLDGYRSELERALGCPLEQMGILVDTPEVRLSVPARGRVGARPLWLDACVPYTLLPHQTAEQLVLEESHAEAILAVENKAVFHHLTEVIGLPPGVGCLWIRGQRGIERRLLARLTDRGRTPVYLWTDIDVWGMYIQDAIRKALPPGTNLASVLMTPDIVRAAKTPQPLTAHHRQLLERVAPDSPWYDLAQEMLMSDRWVEQEELLHSIRSPADISALLRIPANVM